MFWIVAGLLISSLTLSPSATAHAHEYIQGGVGDFFLICDDPETGTQGIGGVCLPPGEVIPGALGEATITATDDVVSPVSGLYCQDLDADSFCGESCLPDDSCLLGCPLAMKTAGPAKAPTAVEFRDQGLGAVHCEPYVPFCASVTLYSPIDTTPRTDWSTANWDPDLTIYIFIDGPVHGNPATSPCGATYSGGTHGFVDHT